MSAELIGKQAVVHSTDDTALRGFNAGDIVEVTDYDERFATWRLTVQSVKEPALQGHCDAEHLMLVND